MSWLRQTTAIQPLASLARAQKPTVRRFQQNFSAQREDQTLKLSDGRKLGFAEYGVATGTPTIFLHGSPGCRYDGLWFNDAAKKLNLRLICPERPGFGLSSFIPDQKLIEYPRDIAQLATHLGLAKYHVFGMSGGGPYVIACAYALPQEELLNVAVVAGMAPPEIARKIDGWRDAFVRTITYWAPWLVRYSVAALMKDDKSLDEGMRNAFKRIMSSKDWAIVSQPDYWNQVLISIREAYSKGADGAIRDSELLDAPWGFELTDVRKEIRLYYGLKDERTPVAFGRYYKENLPNAELVEYEDVSHFTTHRDEETLARIVDSWESDKAIPPVS